VFINSTVDGILWPGIPSPEGALLSSLLAQLEQSQFLSSEQIFVQQSRQLKSLFLHARDSTQFYRQRFTKAGFDPEAPITPDVIRQIPSLTRSDVQEAGDNLNTNSLPPGHGRSFQIKSSGTTGRPVVVSKTTLTQIFYHAFNLRNHIWHRHDLNGKLAIIRYVANKRGMPPQGLSQKHWGARINILYDTGPSFLLNVASSLEDQAQWLMRRKPDYLTSYPSNLIALADHFTKQDYQLPGLRQVITVSEVVNNKVRDACRRAWGVDVTDIYTCEEAGYVAIQCPDYEHYHIQSENVYLEVVNDDGEPCRPGEVGRVLITSLNNFATPLIRYELGDYAEVGESCSCGRGLPVLTRILGRERNRLILPSGESQFPYLGDHEEYREVTTAVQQYQFIQRSLEEVENKMVVSEPLTLEQENKLREIIIKNLGHPFHITFSYHDDIPKSTTGKFEEFICEIQ